MAAGLHRDHYQNRFAPRLSQLIGSRICRPEDFFQIANGQVTLAWAGVALTNQLHTLHHRLVQSQQTKKVKSASLHKEMHKSTVPEWALVMSVLQVVFLCPTSSCHTALNSPTEHSEDAQIAARLTAQLSRKIRSQPKWGLSFPSFLSNASNVGYLRSRRPACYHHLVPIIIFLWQLVQL